MRFPSWLALGLLLPVAAFAQSAPSSRTDSATPAATKIGIINIQEAIQDTQEGKKALADLTTQFQPKKTDLENQQKTIQDLQQQLKDGGNALSADAKAELSRTIQTKQADFQRDAEDAQSDFTNASNDIGNRIGTKMMKVLNAYAQQHGYAVILDVSSPQTPVLFATQAINVTPQIVRLYDQQYPVTTADNNAPGRP